MRKRDLGCAAALVIATSIVVIAQNSNAPRYQLPPKQVIDAFEVQPLSQAILSPTKQVIALAYRKPYPTIAALAQPMLRLAGARINPKTNGPRRTANIYAITIKKIGD